MKYTRLVLLVLLLSSKLIFAQNLEQKHVKTINKFIKFIETRDLEKLKTIVTFPIKRAYPLANIKNETDFVMRYDDVFDAKLIEMIIKSDVKKDWVVVGWRGIMFNNGILWLDTDGNLKAVNYKSESENLKRNRLVEADRASVYKGLAEFEQAELILQTKKFRIRIDKLKNGNYRYASWSKHSKMNEKPDLILKSGNLIPDGSGGNHRYEFKNGNYKYVCAINILRTEDMPEANLIVYKGRTEILNHSGVLITN